MEIEAELLALGGSLHERGLLIETAREPQMESKQTGFLRVISIRFDCQQEIQLTAVWVSVRNGTALLYNVS
jgi:hypothetical protein